MSRELSRRAWLGATGALLSGVAAAAGEQEAPWPIPAWYYQQFNADFAATPPELGFGGWRKKTLPFSRKHTAVVSMHAWETGDPARYPGWWKAVPYMQRAQGVLREVYPELLHAVRNAGLPLFHVVGGGGYYKSCPGYQRAVRLAGTPEAPPDRIPRDPLRKQLDTFRSQQVFPGAANQPDVQRGFKHLDFAPEARPQGEEGVAENGAQLFALCRDQGINHLIYCGFAINWCLLLSPGGMAEMQRYGMFCSAFKEATVAVESKESAPQEREKAAALWRVALAYGFVFEVEAFKTALQA